MGSIKQPQSRAGKLTCRCPECNWPGASHKPHRSFNDIPGLVTPLTVIQCGKCKFASAIVLSDGRSWIDQDAANALVEANYGMKIAEWIDRLNDPGKLAETPA